MFWCELAMRDEPNVGLNRPDLIFRCSRFGLLFRGQSDEHLLFPGANWASQFHATEVGIAFVLLTPVVQDGSLPPDSQDSF